MRMKTSAMRKMRTLRTNPVRISGNDALKSSQLKNDSRTVGQPGRVDHHQDDDPEHHHGADRTDEQGAATLPILIGETPGPPRRDARVPERRLGLGHLAELAGLDDRGLDHIREPLLLDGFEIDVGQRLVDAVSQRVALFEDHPELLTLPG